MNESNASAVLQGNPFKPLASTVSVTLVAAEDSDENAAVHEEVRAGPVADTSSAVADDTAPSETPDIDAANNVIETKDGIVASSFLSAAAAAESLEEEGDVENQLTGNDSGNTSSALEESLPTASTTTAVNIGIFADDEDDTASVFSFDSYEKHQRIPLRVQNMIRKQNNSGVDDSAVPFPSVVGASMEYENVVNVCPCRCLFFTLKETICLIMSALGCAVYLAGLIVLIMYLEGSLFTNN